MLHAVEFDTDTRVFDNESQNDMIRMLYVGMEDGYVPFASDYDQFAYDGDLEADDYLV